MNVLIRETAYDDLRRIYDWIARDSPHNANSVIDRIFMSIERLSAFPGVWHSEQAKVPWSGLSRDFHMSSSIRSIAIGASCRSLPSCMVPA